MKKLLIVLAALALIAGFSVMKAEAAPTADITVTVTLVNLSVTLSDTAWNLSAIPIVAGSTPANKTVTATNDGNITEDLTINCGGGTGGGGTTPWTASADTTAGVNEFVMEVQSSGVTWSLLGGSAVLFGDNIATSGQKAFDLRFTAPTTGSDYATHIITVTVTAAAAA